MSLSFGFLLEDLANIPAPCSNRRADRAHDHDPVAWHDRAKASLRDAYDRGCGVAEATEDYLSARDALGDLFDSIWPEPAIAD
jgi:hypothetical protein